MEIFEAAEYALNALRDIGFDDAQVTATSTVGNELNIEFDRASLLRTTQDGKLGLSGFLDGRKTTTTVSSLNAASIQDAITKIFHEVNAAPQDEANAVSISQTLNFQRGPEEVDLDLLVDKVQELIDYRDAQTPLMHINEGFCAHNVVKTRMLTSRGSDLRSVVGSYSIVAFGCAKEGTVTSSFNWAGGACLNLADKYADEWFGVGAMLHETARQINTEKLDKRFTGEVILSPNAVQDLVVWLLSQVNDLSLIANTSLYKKSIGDSITNSLLTLRNTVDGAGVTPISTDAFEVAPVTLIERGSLQTLLPSLYGSRKTGLPHVPNLSTGWSIDAGETTLASMVERVVKGAMVGRLSMGMPASNGDFSAVIKNTFLIRDGALGVALGEVMISGNVAQMLKDIQAVSRERIDAGETNFPWLLVTGLHFS